MVMFTDAELAEGRAMSVDSMPEACTLIQDGVFDPATDTYGVEERIVVACRRSPLGSTPEERRIADQQGTVALLRVAVPWAAILREKDRMEIGGDLYRVRGVLPTRSYGIEKHLVVERTDD